MDRRISVFLLAAAVLLTLWAYQPVLRGGTFVYEDDHVSQATWTVPGRGLAQWTIHMIGPDANRQHAVNVGIHLLTGVALYALTSALFSPLAGALAASWHLLHPLNSEAVSYLTARGDLLVALFSVLAAWAALRGRAWWLLAGVTVVGSALSKEIGLIALPLVVVTVALWRPYRASGFVVQGLWCALGIVVGAAGLRITSWFTLTASGLSWPEFASLQNVALWHLLALIPWPVGLSIDHDVVALSVGVQALAWTLTATAAGVTVWAWKRYPVVAWAIAWTAVAVAPRLVFSTDEFLHEYYLYPATVGISAAIGVGLARLCKETKGVPNVQISPNACA